VSKEHLRYIGDEDIIFIVVIIGCDDRPIDERQTADRMRRADASRNAGCFDIATGSRLQSFIDGQLALPDTFFPSQS